MNIPYLRARQEAIYGNHVLGETIILVLNLKVWTFTLYMEIHALELTKWQEQSCDNSVNNSAKKNNIGFVWAAFTFESSSG